MLSTDVNMKASVSSIRKKGIGYNIEISIPKKIFGLYSFVKKILFYCSEAGCVDCIKYEPVKEPMLLKLLNLAYDNKKKQENV
jgi:hypothetical protein